MCSLFEKVLFNGYKAMKSKYFQMSSSFVLLTHNVHRIYYQYAPDRLSACPVTIHALLHIADCIEGASPVWATWTFPTERHCGSLTPAVMSRRFPFASIDRHVTEVTQLTQIKMFHRLDDALSLQAPSHTVAGQFSDPNCNVFHALSSTIDCLSSIHRSNLRTAASLQRWTYYRLCFPKDCGMSGHKIQSVGRTNSTSLREGKNQTVRQSETTWRRGHHERFDACSSRRRPPRCKLHTGECLQH